MATRTHTRAAPPPPTPPALRLQALGITPRTKDTAPAGGRFPYVLFAAPPSGSEDYVGEIRAALDLWDGSGAFVFTSSAGVYTVEDGSGACCQTCCCTDNVVGCDLKSCCTDDVVGWSRLRPGLRTMGPSGGWNGI